MTIEAAPPLVYQDESRQVTSEKYGNVTENDIYGAIYPSISNFDVTSSVLQLSNGSTIENATAVAGYFCNENATSPSNPVALFGCGMVTANNGVGWGINTLLQDSKVRQASDAVGRMLIGAELDFNVMNPGTQVIGVSVGGNSLAQPTNANGFLVNTLSQTYGYKWTTGFNSMDGSAIHALNVGMAAASGLNVPSQLVLFGYTSGYSKQNIMIRAEGGGYLVFSGSIPPKGYAFKYADVFLDAGHTIRINGIPVLSSRQGGWGLPYGTINRGGFDPDNISVQQLAQRFGALIADLHAHGLIGA